MTTEGLRRGGPILTLFVYFFQFSNLFHLKNKMERVGKDEKILKLIPFIFFILFFCFNFIYFFYYIRINIFHKKNITNFINYLLKNILIIIIIYIKV